MITPLSPYASAGSQRLVINKTFIEVDETTVTKSSRRAQSEPPPMKQNRGLCMQMADGHLGAEKEITAFSITTDTEDYTTDAGSMTPRSFYSTVDEGSHAVLCDLVPNHPPQNASQAIQETAAASSIFQPHTFQPQTIVRVQDTSRDVCYIRWTVDAKKLRCRDPFGVISPQFELSNKLLGAHLPFKMILTPTSGSFQRAHGQGRMELKYLAPLDDVSNSMTFWFSAGGGRGAEALQSPTGLVRHNFAQASLSKDPEIWDFNGLVDKTSQTFVVCLAVLGPWH